MKKTSVAILLLAAALFAGCQSSASSAARGDEIRQISVEQAKRAVDDGGEKIQFVDVRTESEYRSGHAPRTINIPLDSLANELARLDSEKPVYLICQTGRRSQTAAEILRRNDFKQIYNVEGGTSAWQKAGLPLEK